MELPTGTVTFLFTDIEGSTRLLDELGDRYQGVLAEHHRRVRAAVERHGGVEVDTAGDAFFVAFARASDAVAAAAAAQEALREGAVRVRMGIHTGEPVLTDDGYLGMDVHRAARIMSAGHGGQVLVSRTTRDLLEDAFPLTDLGEHRLKDLSAPQRLYQLGRDEFPPLKSLNWTNLPVQPSPLLGRERELAEAGAILNEHRLTTLVGPGGTGKTRLALQLAADAVEQFEHGVFFVALAALRDPELVEPTIAQAVGSRNGLVEHLRGKRILLLLDNFEHLLEAAPGLAELLQGAADVKVLATSREPLRVSGEHEYPVPPLPEDDAVELFGERARAMKPGFEPDDDVAEICRRLDGLPLALELAAARVKVLTPAQILERLEHRLDLLTGGVRDAPERQRTLRATLEWSHDLLDETERRLFRRLSVFAGAFTLEAVEAVCQAELDTLASLVDKQLLRQTDDACFFMLETIREYAAEQLEQHGEAADFRRAHAEYYLAFSARAAPELRGPSQDEWMARIQREHANFAVAMAFFVDGGLAASALRIGGALTAFWERRGRAGEGRALLEAALQAPSTAAADVRARALYGAGKLAYTQDDHERGRACCEEALTLFRRAGDASGDVLIEIELAWTAVVLGDLETATAKAEECVERARSLGDWWVYAYALRLWGAVLSEAGQLDEAKRANRESLAVFEACGDPREQMGALSVLGWLAIVDEEYEEAGSVTAESIARASEEDAEFLAIARSNLGLVNLFLGRDERAVREFSESLRLSVPLGAQRVAAESLLGIAAAAARASSFDEAARLRGASHAIHEACGATLNPAEERLESRFLADVTERSGELEGRSLTMERAAEYAVQVAASISGTLR